MSVSWSSPIGRSQKRTHPAASSAGAGFRLHPDFLLVAIFEARRDCLLGAGDLARARVAGPPRGTLRSPKLANPGLHPWSRLLPLLRLFQIVGFRGAAPSDCDRIVRLATHQAIRNQRRSGRERTSRAPKIAQKMKSHAGRGQQSEVQNRS